MEQYLNLQVNRSKQFIPFPQVAHYPKLQLFIENIVFDFINPKADNNSNFRAKIHVNPHGRIAQL